MQKKSKQTVSGKDTPVQSETQKPHGKFDKKAYKKGIERAKKENGDLSQFVFGNEPPNALELEEAVLGAILIDSEAWGKVSEILKRQTFYLEAHQEIWAACFHLKKAGDPIDLLTVREALNKKGKLEQIGGAYYLVELTNRVASGANIEAHARIIFEKWVGRKIIADAATAIRAVHDRKDVFDISAELNKATRINSPRQMLITEDMDRSIEQGAKEPPKKLICGSLLSEREVTILFSDEKTGKTVLALQIGHAAANGKALFDRADKFPNECKPMKVQLFDFEMENRELYDRYSDKGLNADNPEHVLLFGENFKRTYFNDEFTNYGDNMAEKLVSAVENEIEKYQPKLVIIDNITWMTKEATDPKIASEFMSQMLKLQKRHGLSIVVIAHTPKRNTSEPLESRNLQGSKNLSNFSKNMIAVARSKKDKSIRYIKHIFSRNRLVEFDEENVIECELEKVGNRLQWTYLAQNAETEHLTVPQDERDMDDLMHEIHELYANKNFSYNQIRTQLGLSWNKSTISRRYAAWKEEKTASQAQNN